MARKSKKRVEGFQNRYDAAGTGRRMRGWSAPSSGPNTALAGAQTVRSRAQDVRRNEWSGASSVRVWTTNMIGTGIIPRPITKDATLKTLLSELWADFVKNADADSVLDFYGLQALVARSWFSDGEVFIRVRPRRTTDGLAVPVQLQVIESAQVPYLDADNWPGMPRGNIIRSGIELSKIRQRTAVWMYRNHPGDRTGTDLNPQELVRVPYDTVLHVYDPQRPGQLRGVSELAPIITRLRGVADFDDTVLERQRLANLFTLFVTKPLPSGFNDQLSGGMLQYGQGGEPIAALEPGISQELLPGEDVKFSDPPDAGANYSDFMRWQYLGVGSGLGTPYELMTGDLRDVSDRTLRIVINEFRRSCQQKQWLIIIPQFCQRVRDAWADYAFMAGVIAEGQVADAKAVRWSPQGWEYIHPVQDVQAKQLEVEAGFRSRSSVIQEKGYDPDDVDQERADDAEREDALGLKNPPPVFGEDEQATDDGDAKPDDEEDDDESESDEGESVVALMKAFIESQRPTEPPVVNITSPVTVTVPEQPATVVNVSVPEQPAPVVNVSVPPPQKTADEIAQQSAINNRILDMLGGGANG